MITELSLLLLQYPIGVIVTGTSCIITLIHDLWIVVQRFLIVRVTPNVRCDYEYTGKNFKMSRESTIRPITPELSDKKGI
jgi:hypothetical protein